MENIKLYRCMECGWETETDYHDLECPICHSNRVRVGDDEKTDEVVAEYLEKENPQVNVKDEVKNLAVKSIKEAFKHFGIERTEDKINEHFGNTPKLQNYMLKTYKAIITGVIK